MTTILYCATFAIAKGAKTSIYLASRKPRIRTIGALAIIAACLGLSTPSRALPSFARQTGKPCAQCHTVAYGPALTAYGRQFKLNGYVWGDAKEVIPPVALMIQGGFTHTDAKQVDPPADHFALNDNLSVDQVSAFYGGRITQHAGAFVQVTYSGEERHTNWDNLDIRYARSASIGDMSAVFGLSINNNPTVQDLWNSTPAWSFPYINSALAPTPAAHTLIAGTFAQLVLGATAYAMLDDHLYLEAGAYRGLSDQWLGNLGLNAGDNLHPQGLSPYWRAAWQTDLGANYFSLGTFGLNSSLQPNPAMPQTDRFNDVGFDATYQFANGSEHTVSANLSVVHEKQSLDASFSSGNSARNTDHLDTMNLDVGYSFRQTWVASVGLFNVSGSTDMGLYAPAAVAGSASGSPDSRGYIVQLEYVPFGKLESFARPWINVRLGLQYTGYERFNGGAANYDGFGRSASDNNTLFGFFWVAM